MDDLRNLVRSELVPVTADRSPSCPTNRQS